MTLYGIPNCDMVKKARTWLHAHHLNHDFHDFRKQGVNASWLMQVIAQTGWQTLLNKRGTTWRKLDSATQIAVTDQQTAIALMLAHPGLIKRPVLETNGRYHLSFSEPQYQVIFGE